MNNEFPRRDWSKCTYRAILEKIHQNEAWNKNGAFFFCWQENFVCIIQTSCHTKIYFYCTVMANLQCFHRVSPCKEVHLLETTLFEHGNNIFGLVKLYKLLLRVSTSTNYKHNQSQQWWKRNWGDGGGLSWAYGGFGGLYYTCLVGIGGGGAVIKKNSWKNQSLKQAQAQSQCGPSLEDGQWKFRFQYHLNCLSKPHFNNQSATKYLLSSLGSFPLFPYLKVFYYSRQLPFSMSTILTSICVFSLPEATCWAHI